MNRTDTESGARSGIGSGAMSDTAPNAGVHPLPGDLERRRLPRRTVGYWRVSTLLVGLPITAVAVVIAVFGQPFGPLIRWLLVALIAGYLLVVRPLLEPPIRRRIFWYAISEDEIDLQHGLIVKARSVIPMNRVQHLKLEHGPIADRFQVATLHIHTAAGAVPMRGLDADEADRIRAQIAKLAGLADDV